MKYLDVLSRVKKDDSDIMKMENMNTIRNGLVAEKSKFEAFVNTTAVNEPVRDDVKVDEKVDNVLEIIKIYRKDYEQDFKPWTERSEVPETNELLEESIKLMHENVLQINHNLENNSKVRQSTIAITQVVKKL